MDAFIEGLTGYGESEGCARAPSVCLHVKIRRNILNVALVISFLCTSLPHTTDMCTQPGGISVSQSQTQCMECHWPWSMANKI